MLNISHFRIIDFNHATLDGYRDLGHRMFRKKIYPIEDIEKLVYLMWDIANIGFLEPLGYHIFQDDMIEKAESKVMVSRKIIFRELP